MSLDILLEAAKYLEYRSEAKARGEEPRDYHAFSKDGSPKGINNHHHHSHLNLNNQSNHHNYKIDLSQCSDRSPDYPYDPRDKKRVGGAGTREVHNKLEKNRRAHLKECFDMLKKQLPNMEERKTSNLSILRGALRYIQVLKRKERSYEYEMEKLAREKIASQQKLAYLKKELSSSSTLDHIDISNFLPDPDNETTTTASEGEDETPSQNQRSVSPDSASMSSSTSSANSDCGLPETPASDKKPVIHTVVQSPTISIPNPQLMKSEGATTAGQLQSSSSSSHHLRMPATVSNVKNAQPQKLIPFHHAAIMNNNTPKTVQATHIQLSAPASNSNSIHIGGMTGVLASHPHAVQVINQGNGVKVITPSTLNLHHNSQLNNGNSVLSSQNGPIHIFSPATSSLMAMAANNKHTNSLVKLSSGQAIGSSAVTLVPSSAIMSVSPQMTNKPLILNQPANRGGASSLMGKTRPPIFSKTPSASGIAYVQPKMASQILQAVSQKALVNAGQSPIASLQGRQIIATSVKPNQVRTTIAPFSQLAHIQGQVVSSSPMSLVNSKGQQHKLLSVIPKLKAVTGPVQSFIQPASGSKVAKQVLVNMTGQNQSLPMTQ